MILRLRLLLLACMAIALATPAAAVTVPLIQPKPVISLARERATSSSLTKAAQTTTAKTAQPVIIKPGQALKKILIHASIIEESASRTPGSLDAFLKQRLGSRYHLRSEWAGRSGTYRPRLASWRVWRLIGNVRYVTIHHSTGVPLEHPAAMIRNIFRGHTSSNGRLDAPDVGYHFFVDRDGGIWEGRDANHLGTHVGSTPDGLNNAGNLGVCGLGNFKYEAPPKAMSSAAVELCDLLAEYYRHPLVVRGHNDWIDINRFHPLGGTDCPGRLESAVRQANARITKKFPKKPAKQLAKKP